VTGKRGAAERVSKQPRGGDVDVGTRSKGRGGMRERVRERERERERECVSEEITARHQDV
jgi:hypothetical protein